MHILVVSNHWSKKNNVTNASIWADRQILALRQLGVQVDTFDIGTSHAPWRLFRKWLELRRTVQRLKPDLVHARYGTIVAALSVCAGCPAVVTYAGSDLQRGAGISLLRTYLGLTLSNLASLRAAAIICVSEGLRQALWWRSQGAVVIPDGVNLDLFVPHPRDGARQKLGWDLRTPVVLIDAARDPVGKGLALAEQAIQVARSRISDVQLKVLAGVKGDEMPLYCSAADLLLCASRREGSPNIVKEALACNLPVVSAPVGDVRELLAGVTPSRVAAREPVELGNAIIEVLSRKARSNGREHVAHLGLDLIARRVLSVYQSTLGSLAEQTAPCPAPSQLK